MTCNLPWKDIRKRLLCTSWILWIVGCVFQTNQIYFRSYETPYVLKNLPPPKCTIVIRTNSNSKTLLDWINLKVFMGCLNSLLYCSYVFRFIKILFRQRPYSVNCEKVNILCVFSIPLSLITYSSKESTTFDQITSKLHDCVHFILLYILPIFHQWF